MLKLQIFESAEGTLYCEYEYKPYVTWVFELYYRLQPRTYIVVWITDMDDTKTD